MFIIQQTLRFESLEVFEWLKVNKFETQYNNEHNVYFENC